MSNSRQRASRNQRKTDPEPLQLTERDLDVFETLYDYRWVTTEHLVPLHYNSKDAAYKRLRRLYDHTYIKREPQGDALSMMNKDMLYRLDRRGAEALQLHRQRATDWKTPHLPKSLFMQHLFEINTVRVAIDDHCRRHPDMFTLVRWLDDATLSADYAKVLTATGSGLKRVPIRPDGYFQLQTPSGKSDCFLELDRGTMTIERFNDKLHGYLAYMTRGFPEQFGGKYFRILTVTLSATRADHLYQAASQITQDIYCWFTTLDQVSSATVLTAPIWQVTGMANKVNFFGQRGN
jgi:hypothetical protein